jgi:hypothetical protein
MLDSVNRTTPCESSALVLAAVAGRSRLSKTKTKGLPKDTLILAQLEKAFRVTVPGHSVQKDNAVRTKTLNRVAEGHRRAQTEMPNASAVTPTETTLAESEGAFSARYGGVETSGHRRFANLLLCYSSAATIYCDEGFGSTEAGFEAGAKTTINSIVVPR